MALWVAKKGQKLALVLRVSIAVLHCSAALLFSDCVLLHAD